MRIWLKPDRMAALNISPVQVRQALAANNFLAAVGQTKGSLIQVNLTANTDLRSVEEFKRLVVVQEQDGAIVRLEDIADVVLGAEDYDTEVRFSGQTAVFMGIWPLPNANSLDVIERVRAEMDGIQKELPTGMQARVAYDATDYINNAIHEVVKTLTETLLIVMRHHFPLPRLLPLGAGAGGGDPPVADRRGFSDAGVRFHHQPADAAGHRAVGRSGGGRCHRGGGKRRAPLQPGRDAAGCRACSARANWSGRSSP